MKLRVSQAANGYTQDYLVPVVAFGPDYAVLRQGLAVMVLDVVGPNLESSSDHRQQAALAAWADTILHMQCSVSHHLVVDERATLDTQRYFAERWRSLAGGETSDGSARADRSATVGPHVQGERRRVAAVAREWALHLARFRMVRCRSLLVCSRPLPSTVASVSDPRVVDVSDLLRGETDQIMAALQRQQWTASRLERAHIEDAIKEVFDPFARRAA